MSFTKRIVKKSDDDLIDYPINDKVEGWYFRISELSQGYYRVEGLDRFGRVVSRDGIDVDELLEKCIKDAREIIKE